MSDTVAASNDAVVQNPTTMDQVATYSSAAVSTGPEIVITSSGGGPGHAAVSPHRRLTATYSAPPNFGNKSSDNKVQT